MIRIVAVGLVGLVGTGALTALGRIPAPETSQVATAIQYPMADTTRKRDRLPLKAQAETIAATVLTGAMAMATMEDTSPAPTVPAPVEVATKPAEPKASKAPPKIISRHWHDSVDAKPKVSKRSYRSPPVRAEAPPPVTEVKNCSEGKFDTFLRTIKMKPDCNS